MLLLQLHHYQHSLIFNSRKRHLTFCKIPLPHILFHLPLHIHLRLRFELHLKTLIINRDLLYQPPYQQFIILRDLSGLLFQELPHLPDPLFLSFPLSALHQSVLLQFPQPVNLIRNTVIILFRICQL